MENLAKLAANNGQKLRAMQSLSRNAFVALAQLPRLRDRRETLLDAVLTLANSPDIHRRLANERKPATLNGRGYCLDQKIYQLEGRVLESNSELQVIAQSMRPLWQEFVSANQKNRSSLRGPGPAARLK